MHHADLEPEILQSTRRFETEQAAADHRGALLALCPCRDLAAIVQRAEHEDARLETAIGHGGSFHRRNEGTAAGRDDQLVVGLGLPVFAVHKPSPAQKPCGTRPDVRRMLFSRYQESGFRKISSSLYEPFSTFESRMRL